jgi:hypothetical protein
VEVAFQVDPRNGIAFRVAKSRRRCASIEKRDPTIFRPSKPSLSNSERRREGLEDAHELGPLVDRLAKRQRAELGASRPQPPARSRRAHARQQVDVAGELLRSWTTMMCGSPRELLEHLDRAGHTT